MVFRFLFAKIAPLPVYADVRTCQWFCALAVNGSVRTEPGTNRTSLLAGQGREGPFRYLTAMP
jgi:hypothetical protein